MDKLLMMRVNILKDSGEIDEQIASAVVDFINHLENKLKIQINEENGSMLVTHLCMALVRIKKGGGVKALDANSLAELERTSIFDKMPSLISGLEKQLKFSIPESELGYIALHLCSITENQKDS